MSWQPIDTAPKDTTILLFYPLLPDQAFATYHPAYDLPGVPGRDRRIQVAHWSPWGWDFLGALDPPYSGLDPTHWMLAPSEPA